MPWKAIGKVVYKKTNGWHKKQKCRSSAAAKAAVHLLYGIKHGWKPTGRRRRRAK